MSWYEKIFQGMLLCRSKTEYLVEVSMGIDCDMYVYYIDFVGKVHKKTVDSGYFRSMTQGLGAEWWKVYTL